MRVLGRRLFVVGLLLVATNAFAASPDKTGKAMPVSDRNTHLDKMLADARPEIAEHWKGCREAGLEEMTQKATDAVDTAIGDYFAGLKALPEPANDAQILEVMKRLYEKLNVLNEQHNYGLLETDERELLVPIFIDAAAVCGIDPEKYDGEPGGEYRDF